jgi:hypothetical protein
MTPKVASETVVEYDFRCFCGAPIIATEKTADCNSCGRIFEIRRIRRHTHQPWKRTHRWYTPPRIGVAQDVLQLVEKPIIYFILYSLLLYDLYDLLHW